MQIFYKRKKSGCVKPFDIFFTLNFIIGRYLMFNSKKVGPFETTDSELNRGLLINEIQSKIVL